MKGPTTDLSASNKTKRHWTMSKFFSGFHVGED
jgi:hypothetical protein